MIRNLSVFHTTEKTSEELFNLTFWKTHTKFHKSLYTWYNLHHLHCVRGCCKCIDVIKNGVTRPHGHILHTKL